MSGSSTLSAPKKAALYQAEEEHGHIQALQTTLIAESLATVEPSKEERHETSLPKATVLNELERSPL